MRCPHCGFAISAKKIAADMGAKGGRKSRRTLTTEQARAMVVAREKKKSDLREASE